MSAVPDQSKASPDRMRAPGGPARLFRQPMAGAERLNVRRTWPVLFLIVAALLACRQPYALIHPTFFAEDGAVFFKQQYEMGFAASLATRYAGYPHFSPRILAGLCSVLPIEYIPLAYTIVSLLVAAGTLTFFFAPGFRPIINCDRLRACMVVVFTLMPNADPLMKLADVNWYMLMFTSLLVLFSLPEHRLARWLLFLLAGLAAWSNPATVVYVPVMLYRAWTAGSDSSLSDRKQIVEERVWWTLLAAVTMSFLLVVERQHGVAAMVLHEQNWIIALFHAIAYRVFCFFFLGPMIMYPRVWHGWGMVSAVGLTLAALCIAVALVTAVKAKKPGTRRDTPLMLLYLILALPALFVLRKTWQRFFLNWSMDAWQENDRYFMSSTLLLCVLGGVVFERLYRQWMKKTKLRWDVSMLVFIVWLIFQGLGFQMDSWYKGKHWSDYARKIHQAEARVRQTGHYESVSIDGSPAGWDWDLMITAGHK